MHVQVRGACIAEQALDPALRLSPVNEIGIDDHVRCIEGAQRERSRAEHLRNGVDSVESALRTLAHEDRVTRSVRRRRRLVRPVEEEQRLSGLRVSKLDSVRVARPRVRRAAQGAEQGQLGLGPVEQVAKRLGRQA